MAEHELVTAPEPEAIDRTGDGSSIRGNGRDVAFARATVTDADGTRVPDASTKIQFGIDAPGDNHTETVRKPTPFTGGRTRVVTPHEIANGIVEETLGQYEDHIIPYVKDQ